MNLLPPLHQNLQYDIINGAHFGGTNKESRRRVS
jgi:hypothetical protein